MVAPGLEHLNLDVPPTGVIWIKTLYVSDALQSSGVGRAAMDALEEMAIAEPFCATTLMLDTVSKEDQARVDFATAFYGHVPKVRTCSRPSVSGGVSRFGRRRIVLVSRIWLTGYSRSPTSRGITGADIGSSRLSRTTTRRLTARGKRGI